MPTGQSFVITGTHTGAGKTLVAGVLAAGLGADYWKPVQAGTEPETDSQWVARHAAGMGRIHPEAYLLPYPESPHSSAARAGVAIDPARLTIPHTENTLIIEGAGGVLVPLAEDLLYADMFARWAMPVVLVVQHTLGCINHTLLSLEALHTRSVPVHGLVFCSGNPADTAQTEAMGYLLRRSGLPLLGNIPLLASPLPPLAQLYRQYMRWQ